MNTCRTQSRGERSLPELTFLMVILRNSVETRERSFSIVDFFCLHPVPRTEPDSLIFQESPLHRNTALKSTQGSIRSHCPVTGNDEWKRIASQSSPHCSGASPSQVAGDLSVGAHPPTGYSVFSEEYVPLERRAHFEHKRIERKNDLFSSEKSADLNTEMFSLVTRSLFHMREQHHGTFPGTVMFIRKEYAQNSVPVRDSPPHDTEWAETTLTRQGEDIFHVRLYSSAPSDMQPERLLRSVKAMVFEFSEP